MRILQNSRFLSLILVGVLTCQLSAQADYVLDVTGSSTSGLDNGAIFRGTIVCGSLIVQRKFSDGTQVYGDSDLFIEIINTSSTDSTPIQNDIEGELDFVWTSDNSEPTSLYRFSYDVKAVAFAEAQMDISNIEVGRGKVETQGYAKLIADTATMDADSDEKTVKAGAQVIEDYGGLTGFGIGAFEVSFSWDNPNPQVSDPSITVSEPVWISAVDDDPGSQCFIKLRTAIWGKVYDTKKTVSLRYGLRSRAKGRLDSDYENDISSPELINP